MRVRRFVCARQVCTCDAWLLFLAHRRYLIAWATDTNEPIAACAPERKGQDRQLCGCAGVRMIFGCRVSFLHSSTPLQSRLRGRAGAR